MAADGSKAGGILHGESIYYGQILRLSLRATPRGDLAAAASLALAVACSQAIDLRRPPSTPFIHVHECSGKERDGYGVKSPKPHLLALGWVKEPNTQICTNIIF